MYEQKLHVCKTVFEMFLTVVPSDKSGYKCFVRIGPLLQSGHIYMCVCVCDKLLHSSKRSSIIQTYILFDDDFKNN